HLDPKIGKGIAAESRLEPPLILERRSEQQDGIGCSNVHDNGAWCSRGLRSRFTCSRRTDRAENCQDQTRRVLHRQTSIRPVCWQRQVSSLAMFARVMEAVIVRLGAWRLIQNGSGRSSKW